MSDKMSKDIICAEDPIGGSKSQIWCLVQISNIDSTSSNPIFFEVHSFSLSSLGQRHYWSLSLVLGQLCQLLNRKMRFFDNSGSTAKDWFQVLSYDYVMFTRHQVEYIIYFHNIRIIPFAKIGHHEKDHSLSMKWRPTDEEWYNNNSWRK